MMPVSFHLHTAILRARALSSRLLIALAALFLAAAKRIQGTTGDAP